MKKISKVNKTILIFRDSRPDIVIVQCGYHLTCFLFLLFQDCRSQMGYMMQGFLPLRKMVAVMVGLKASGRSGGQGKGDINFPNK